METKMMRNSFLCFLDAAAYMSLPDFTSEIMYSTARSGGAGGQNVNKVETMVEGRWMVADSAFFSPDEKARIAEQLRHRILASGHLHLKVQQERSQLANKQLLTRKMHALVATALQPQKLRKPTRPSAASKQRKRMAKTKTALQKALRRKPGLHE